MKRHVYQARFKRIIFTVLIAILIAMLLGLSLYFTLIQAQQENWWLFTAGLFISIVALSLFGVSIREASIAIQRRGYSRPIGTQGSLERVVKSIFVSELDKSHPAQYQRSSILVRFDGGSEPYRVDLGKLYFVLLDEVSKSGSLLSWDRCVVKNKMDKKAWAAYRRLLQDAEVVDIDGRGSMRLNCTPWAAIEIVKERC